MNFSDGLAVVVDIDANGTKKHGFINKKGEEIIPCMYAIASYFSNGKARVRDFETQKEYYIDKVGNAISNPDGYILPEECIYGGEIADGLASVELNGKYGIIDKNGNLLLPLEYDYIRRYDNGLAAVKSGGKWGLIDESFNIVVSCKYDDVGRFENGLCRVERYYNDRPPTDKQDGLNKKKGWIDKTGKEIVPCIYEICCTFKDGRAFVASGSYSVFRSFDYEEISFYGKSGYYDREGNQIVPCVHDYSWREES
jgi:hypothetical protein